MFDAEQARKNSEAKRCEMLNVIMESILAEIESCSKYGLRECVISDSNIRYAREPYPRLFDMVSSQSFTNEWKSIKYRIETLGFKVIDQTEFGQGRYYITIIINW